MIKSNQLVLVMTMVTCSECNKKTWSWFKDSSQYSNKCDDCNNRAKEIEDDSDMVGRCESTT